MANRRPVRNARPLADLLGGIVDPALRKRSGVSLGLLQSWEEIAGPRLARLSRPDRIAWPRRLHEDDPFQPATLTIAAEGYAALALQHETGELLSRVNAFLGYAAIGRIRIVQKRVAETPKPARPTLRPLRQEEEADLKASLEPIENERLRSALDRLGRVVKGERRPAGGSKTI